MRNRIFAVLNVLLIGCAIMVMAMPNAVPAMATDQTAPEATQDILHMRDGRVLQGKILNETRLVVIFEYVDAAVNSKAKLTLLKENILQIDRDIVVTADQQQPAQDSKAVTPAAKPRTSTGPAPARTFGTARVQSNIEDVPSVYIVPMKGQLVTDVRAEVYRKIVDEIKSIKPSVIVIEMSCQDIDESWNSMMGQIDQKEMGILDYDNSAEMVDMFRNELRGIPQVMWVHNSIGMSSMVALSWSDVYMTPSARLAGMVMVLLQSGATGWQDPNVRLKMYAAWVKGAIGFLERGGYSHELGKAMIDPKHFLSASWHGRDVRWSLDTNGEYLVDGTDEWPANFNAKLAEDFCISKGTAETLDDLALLLGYREYRVIDGSAQKTCEDYIRDWRRAYEDTKVLLMDIRQFEGWATGQDEVKYLGRMRTSWEKILSNMDRFKAVEIRLAREFGLSREEVIAQIEELKERLRAARGNTGRGSGGGVGGGSGGTGRAN